MSNHQRSSQYHNYCCRWLAYGFQALRAVGLWCGLLLFTATAFGVTQSPRGKELFPRLGKKTELSPLPLGVDSSIFRQVISTPVTPEPPPNYGTNFHITSIQRSGAASFVVRWTNGPAGATYQLQGKVNVLQPMWANIGSSTTNHAVTNFISGPFQVFKVAATSAPPASGQVQWLVGGNSQAGFNCRGRTIAVDHAGNYIMAGVYQGTISFGSFTLTNAGGIDAFMVKYNPAGAVLWVKGITGTFNETANGIAVDASDNIVLTGDFSGTVDFGGTNLTYTTPHCCALPDIFVAKYTPAGNLIWAKKFGGNSGDSGNALALDAAGNIFLAASISSTNADFSPFFLTGPANTDIAIAKLLPSGAVQWAKRYGSSDVENPRSLAVNATDVWIAGDFRNVTDLGGGPVPSAGNADGFIARYSAATGTYQTAKFISTPGNDGGFGCAVDGGGNVYLCGQYGGPFNFGCGSVATPGGIFVASYTSGGLCRWARSINHPNFGFSPSLDFANSICFDPPNIELTGQASVTVSFDGATTSSGTGIPNYFAASYDLNGNYRWHSRAGASAIGQGISQGGIAGSFSGQMTLGGQTITGPPFGSAPFTVKITP